MKRAPRSRQRHDLYAKYHDYDSEISDLLGECGFVVSAGNASQNIDYAGDLPGTINLPNVLTVGAADEAGKPASFASEGTSVDLYAPGTNVETLVPGGGRLRDSGASLSAPRTVNVAAKLLSVRPELTASDLASLLVRSATPLPGARARLLDGKSALALLRRRHPEK
jgi:subtilisin family serine protease